jgi:ERCC4-type nuclease
VSPHTQPTPVPASELIPIVIDNREQTPWHFPEWVASVRWGTLSAGDYAIDGDLHFAIERKSLNDFLGTIATGWDRFNRELDRMQEAQFPARVVIVEGDMQACVFVEGKDGDVRGPSHNHPRLTPAFVQSRIADLTLMGVSVIFAHDCIISAAMAVAIFRHRHRQLRQEDQTNVTSTSTTGQCEA